MTQDSRAMLKTVIRDAYREECEAGECDCVTEEEHRRSLEGKGR
jgi:hypothetical protein